MSINKKILFEDDGNDAKSAKLSPEMANEVIDATAEEKAKIAAQAPVDVTTKTKNNIPWTTIDNAITIDDNGEPKFVSNKVALAIQNTITEAADYVYSIQRAAARSLSIKSDASNTFTVAIGGLPGAAKTATVYDWCKRKGLKTISVNLNSQDAEYLFTGVAATSKETNEFKFLSWKSGWERFNEAPFVLILDEFTRPYSDKVWNSLLSLLNNREITAMVDNKLTTIRLNKLIMVFAIYNPKIGRTDNVKDIGGAMQDRLAINLEVNSTPAAAAAYFSAAYLNKTHDYANAINFWTNKEAAKAKLQLSADMEKEYDKKAKALVGQILRLSDDEIEAEAEKFDDLDSYNGRLLGFLQGIYSSVLMYTLGPAIVNHKEFKFTQPADYASLVSGTNVTNVSQRGISKWADSCITKAVSDWLDGAPAGKDTLKDKVYTALINGITYIRFSQADKNMLKSVVEDLFQAKKYANADFNLMVLGALKKDNTIDNTVYKLIVNLVDTIFDSKVAQSATTTDSDTQAGGGTDNDIDVTNFDNTGFDQNMPAQAMSAANQKMADFFNKINSGAN